MQASGAITKTVMNGERVWSGRDTITARHLARPIFHRQSSQERWRSRFDGLDEALRRSNFLEKGKRGGKEVELRRCQLCSGDGLLSQNISSPERLFSERTTRPSAKKELLGGSGGRWRKSERAKEKDIKEWNPWTRETGKMKES